MPAVDVDTEVLSHAEINNAVHQAWRTAMIEKHKSLAEAIVNNLLSKVKITGLERGDLQSEAYIGLIKAVDTFNPLQGVKFTTYATHRIRGELLHALRDQTRLVRVAAHAAGSSPRESLLTLDELLYEASDEAEHAECTARLDVSRRVKMELSEASHDAATETRLDVRNAIAQLRPKRAEAVRLHFLQDLNKTEVARMMGISNNYAGYLIKHGLEDLRAILDDSQGDGSYIETA
jgi:RNA polymerase sigma factor (sigma-70 family)